MRALTPRRMRRLGALVLAVNIGIAIFSAVDLYILAAGALQVELPDADDIDLHLDLRDGSVIVSAQFAVINRGIYEIFDLDIDAVLLDEEMNELLRYESHDLRVPANSQRSFTIESKLAIDQEYAARLPTLLQQPREFTLDVEVRASYIAGLARFWSHEVLTHTLEPPLPDLGPTATALDLSNRTGDEPVAHPEQLRDALQEHLPQMLAWAALVGGGWTQQALSDYLAIRYALVDGALHVELVEEGASPEVVAQLALPLGDILQVLQQQQQHLSQGESAG